MTDGIAPPRSRCRSLRTTASTDRATFALMARRRTEGTAPMVFTPRSRSACFELIFTRTFTRLGDYFCGCSGSMCPPNVGQLPVAQEVAGYARWAKLETAGPSAYWLVNLGDRVGGLWYSTFGSGDCDSSSKTACSWKLTETVKKVKQVCLEAGMRKRVEALLPSCFGKCPGKARSASTSAFYCYLSDPCHR